jgi:hypothetical protein
VLRQEGDWNGGETYFLYDDSWKMRQSYTGEKAKEATHLPRNVPPGSNACGAVKHVSPRLLSPPIAKHARISSGLVSQRTGSFSQRLRGYPD